MTTLLIEPFGGLAGDMLLAALLDLRRPGFGFAELEGFVERLLPGECALELREVKRGSLRASELVVRTGESADPPHRHLRDLLEHVERSPLPERGKARAERVLRAIAEAEARVHGTSVERVHFHEVGAVDTLVDVCGAAFALERLAVERVLSRPPYAGGGSVRCAHGEMPVPAPGTAAILGSRPWILGVGGERLTPTGAALYAALSEDAPDGLVLAADAQGYGAGNRDPAEGPPNLVRLQWSAAAAVEAAGAVLCLSFNLDDATGEEVAFLCEALREAGALDAWTAPVQMKKGRPGVVVSLLCEPARREELERLAFDHSPTLGVRWTRAERTVCARETVTVELDGAPVRVKVRRRPGRSVPERCDLSPEHDDLAVLARARGLALRSLEARVVELALRSLGA